MDDTKPTVIPPELAVPGPNLVGATGGSGTRVVAKILRRAGLYTGDKLNPYEDAVEFGFYSDRWINRYLAAGELPEDMRGEMETDLRSVLADHAGDIPAEAAAWGWKEPRSIYLLRFWNETMPTIRFLHFLRDGRDMAFSENQQQLTKHGDAVLGDDLRKAKTPTRSIAVWTRVNLAAADYGERELGSRYLRVRFEDLCADPASSVAQIYDFFGLEGDAEAAAAEVRPPDTLGRWELRRKRVIEELNADGRARARALRLPLARRGEPLGERLADQREGLAGGLLVDERREEPLRAQQLDDDDPSGLDRLDDELVLPVADAGKDEPVLPAELALVRAR